MINLALCYNRLEMPRPLSVSSWRFGRAGCSCWLPCCCSGNDTFECGRTTSSPVWRYKSRGQTPIGEDAHTSRYPAVVDGFQWDRRCKISPWPKTSNFRKSAFYHPRSFVAPLRPSLSREMSCQQCVQYIKIWRGR